MPIVESQDNTFEDPIIPVPYGDSVVPETEWGSVGGLGAPEDEANVTGDHIFRQDAEPTADEGAKEGDLWFDTNDDNHPKQLVDNVWTSVRDSSAPSAPGTGKWAHNLVFSVTDYNTVAWGTGTITLPDGTSYTIDAGNTGNMAAVSYIFLDTTVSTTVLQVTTTASASVGANRILVAVAKQNSDTAKDAEFQAFGGFGQSTFIAADNIAAGTITADEIAANTITAGKLSVSQLSAIAADLGSITAGTVTGATLQTASGATSGIKMDGTSLRGYNAAGAISFQLDPSTGDATATSFRALVRTVDFVGFKTDGMTESFDTGGNISRGIANTVMTADQLGDGCVLHSNASQLWGLSVGPDTWGKQLEFNCQVACESTTEQDIFLGVGCGTTAAAADVPQNATSTLRHVGFFVQDGTLYASNADGTTQTKTDISSGITLTNWNTYALYYDGTSLRFYVNGSLKATHTTNIPGSGTTDWCLYMGIRTDPGGGDRSMNLNNNYSLRIRP